MENTGYFQMPRWLRKSPIIRNEYEELAIIELYDKAKYIDELVTYKGKTVTLKRGDVATAPGEFAKQLRGNYWTKDKMNTFWKRLERVGWIKIKTIPSLYTIITLLHYVKVENTLGTDSPPPTEPPRQNPETAGVEGKNQLGNDSAQTRELPTSNKIRSEEDNNSSSDDDKPIDDDSSPKCEKDDDNNKESEVSNILGKEDKSGSNSKNAKKSDSSSKVKKEPASSVILANLFYDNYKFKLGTNYPRSISIDRNNMNYLLKEVGGDIEKAKQVIITFFETDWIKEFNIFSLIHERILPKIIAYADKKNTKSDKEERIKQINLSHGKTEMGFQFIF